MPFQSEKQRRYLWANEPEIARDWTDTYGSGIAKALGGRIGFWNGSGNIRQQPHQPRDLLVQNNPYGTRPRYQPPGGGETSLGSGAATSGGGGPPGGGDRQMTYTAPPTRSRIQDERQEDFRKKQMANLLAQQQAEKDYTRQGIMKTGPQLGFAPTRGPNIGNWASGLAGSKIGGGLGSMLFGPWGALLGALFGRGVGTRAWQARQTDEKETAKDILLGQNTLLSNLFNKKKTPTIRGEGDQGILGIKDKINQLGDKPSEKMIVDGQLINRGDQFARARRLLTQPGMDIQLEPNDPNVPDEIEFFDGQSFKARQYDPYKEMYDKDILDARQADYDADLAQIGEGAGYIGPTQEELAAGINLGDLTDEVWTGGKGLERMNQSEYENYLRGYR